MERNDIPAIEVRDLTIGYGKRVVQRDLSFSIRAGSVTCILGGSGCGKSTLLKHLFGLRRPISGDILIRGESIVSAATEEDRHRIMRQFGVAYQNGALFRSLSVAENVALPLREFTKLSEPEIRGVVQKKLQQVGLAGFDSFMPSDLSGGMVKRAAFARAMALDPAILFFDEPSAGLDPISSANLDRLILDIREQTGATILIVTHELPSIFTVADRVIMLGAGAGGIIGDGNPSELKEHTDSDFVRAFLNRKVGNPTADMDKARS